jgi:hypothetical protein
LSADERLAGATEGVPAGRARVLVVVVDAEAIVVRGRDTELPPTVGARAARAEALA